MTTSPATMVERVVRRTRAAARRRFRPKPHIAINLDDLRALLGRRCRTILEIGANDGVDSMRLRRTFPKATIHCFEPDPRAYASAARRIAGSGIHLHQLAIGNDDGTTTFHQSSGTAPWCGPDTPTGAWDKSGSIRAPKKHLEQHPWCTFDESTEVEIRRLDTWARDHGVHEVDFIWADVQGAEVDMILGGSTLLASTRYLYTEYSDLELYEGQVGLEQLLAMLPGWEIAQRFPNDVLLRNTALSKHRRRR